MSRITNHSPGRTLARLMATEPPMAVMMGEVISNARPELPAAAGKHDGRAGQAGLVHPGLTGRSCRLPLAA